MEAETGDCRHKCFLTLLQGPKTFHVPADMTPAMLFLLAANESVAINRSGALKGIVDSPNRLDVCMLRNEIQ